MIPIDTKRSLKALKWFVNELERNYPNMKKKYSKDSLLRNYISRSYYYIFIFARSILEVKEGGLMEDFNRRKFSRNWHTDVNKYFGKESGRIECKPDDCDDFIDIDPINKFSMEEEQVALFYDLFKQLRIKRNIADYDHEDPLTESWKDEIRERCIDLEKILLEIENYV